MITTVDELRVRRYRAPTGETMKDGINRKNLQKLATFLAYGELPKEVKFNMARFCMKDGAILDDEEITRPFCGTSACAVGFAPFAGIRKFKKESFFDFSCRAFIDNEERDEEWEWCFDAMWRLVDNTPKGAAKRIQYLLDKGIGRWNGDYDEDAKKLYARTKVQKPEGAATKPQTRT